MSCNYVRFRVDLSDSQVDPINTRRKLPTMEARVALGASPIARDGKGEGCFASLFLHCYSVLFMLTNARSFAPMAAALWVCLTGLAFAQSPDVSSDAAGPADIGFIGLHGGVFSHLQEHAEPLQLRLRYFDDASIAQKTVRLSDVQVLYIQHIREEDREAYKTLLEEAKKNNPALKIIVFQASSAEFLRGLGLEQLLHADDKAVRYYGSSRENLRRLLVYTAATYLNRDLPIEPPQEAAREGLYHPDHAELFPTAEAFLTWKRSRGPLNPHQPRLLITVHGAHLEFQQPKVVDAIIREAEKQGAIAVAIVDGRNALYEREAVAFMPQAVIHTCHALDPPTIREKLNVPHLHSIFLRKQTIPQWMESVDGLSTSELAFHVIGQELIGAIEPQVGAGLSTTPGGSDPFEPIPERIEHLVGRALSYAKLALTPAREKKIAMIYYDREMGKGELMRGSSTGMHMNGPRSMVAVLKKMKDHGYQIDPLPAQEEELLTWMIERGRQIGVWAPAELDRLARRGAPALVPAETYRKWFEERISADRRKQVEEKWGPAPGRFMVWKNEGKEYIVIPRIELGNILLLPQPLRGEVHGKEEASAQTHDKVSAPPHNYLATYFWLEEEFGANALIHFGTHGSEFALPGKPNGLARRDWPDIIMGRMPNFNPWIIENMVESSPVRRRAYGTLISHLPPPIVNAGLSDALANIHDLLDKYETMEEGALKTKFREEITRQTLDAKLDNDLNFTVEPNRTLSDEQIRIVSDYLHAIAEETTPTSLHVFGEPPRGDLLIPYMVNILRTPYLKAIADLLHARQHELDIDHDHHHGEWDHEVRPKAEQLLHLVLERNIDASTAVGMVIGKEPNKLPEDLEKALKLAQRLYADFQRTTDEIDNLLLGLDGKFVPPGPGNSPIRNPNAVPTGRNMYLLNPDEIPTRPSWELGVKLAKELIANHQKETGAFPTKVAFDLRSSATFRDYGVMEAQILYLIGVEPIWDERQMVLDVRLIDRETLGRPRVDVFIAAGGWYESNLAGRLNLWDKAVRLAAEANEPDNPLYLNTHAHEQLLLKQGLAGDRAALLARGRIFSIAPGRETGSALAPSLLRSGEWTSREELAAQYHRSHQYVYTEGAWGEEAAPLYHAAMQGTHTVVRSWSDHLTGPLASRYTWLHGGALSLAVESATGKRPKYLFADVRDPAQSKMVDAEDALQKEYRVRLFNRKWLEGMMKEGYAGADHIRSLTTNSFAWEVMRPGSVGDANWTEMKKILLDDKLNLGLPAWMEQNNPYAYQDAKAVMLEAIRKGYWNAEPATIKQIAASYAESVARHGLSGNIMSGGNQPLDQFVRGAIAGAPELAEKYAQRIEEQTQLTAADAAPADLAAAPETPAADASPSPAAAAPQATVTGQQLTPMNDETSGDSPAIPPLYWAAGFAAAAIFFWGLLRRSAA